MEMTGFEEGCYSRGDDLKDETRKTLNVEPKHKIFLSHSGAQKDFVEQLCKDLEAATYYPFFDRRSHCLLKGKRFAPEIIACAQQCLVAVVVLSEEYLTSKWPMLELVEFVKAKNSDNPNLDLLPLFYKLSVEDLSAESFENRWKVAWAEIAQNDPRLDLKLCTKALRQLRGSNGLKFEDFQTSEVSYREAIVKEISLLLPPDLQDDTSDVVGVDRLCKIFSQLFVEDTRDSWGTKKLGLYGMGGLGKTTVCRVLCKYFHGDFYGRVCHVELGTRSPLAQQKMVLTKLLRLNAEVVASISTTSQGRKCLQEHMRRDPVFLVVDNITDDEHSQEEARAYLGAAFHPHSRIMITSRSPDVTKSMFFDSKSEFCKAMPCLTDEEAASIFMRRAAPQRKPSTLTDEEQRILKACLDQCRFSPEGRVTSRTQYHPLALRALAVYYHEIDNFNLLSWEKYLGDVDKFKLSRDSSTMFGILGLQISTFDRKKILLFLDVALYYGKQRWRLVDDCVRWLAEIHEQTTRTMERQLQHLARSGIINFTMNRIGIYQENLITLHDLYLEFAEWHVTKVDSSQLNDLWCVYHTASAMLLPYYLRCDPPSRFWPHLERIWIEKVDCKRLPYHKIQEWRNVVVLQLHSFPSLTILDLHGLKCLRHLELVGLKKLETFRWSESISTGKIPTQATLESLQFVILRGLTSLKRLPDFSLCASLQTFTMTRCSTHLTMPPNFEHCSRLYDLRMDWQDRQVKLPKLNKLTSLTSLWIGKVDICKDGVNLLSFEDAVNLLPLEDKVVKCGIIIEGLKACNQLQKIYLGSLPISSLPGLEKLTKLQRLILPYCSNLKDITGVTALTQLEEIDIRHAKIRQIPGLDKLLKLRRLDCSFCKNLSRLPDLHHLPRLEYVNTQGCRLLQVQPRVPSQCEHFGTDPNLFQFGCSADVFADGVHERYPLCSDEVFRDHFFKST